jgi:hypothetical protein
MGFTHGYSWFDPVGIIYSIHFNSLFFEVLEFINPNFECDHEVVKPSIAPGATRG